MVLLYVAAILFWLCLLVWADEENVLRKTQQNLYCFWVHNSWQISFIVGPVTCNQSGKNKSDLCSGLFWEKSIEFILSAFFVS